MIGHNTLKVRSLLPTSEQTALWEAWHFPKFAWKVFLKFVPEQKTMVWLKKVYLPALFLDAFYMKRNWLHHLDIHLSQSTLHCTSSVPPISWPFVYAEFVTEGIKRYGWIWKPDVTANKMVSFNSATTTVFFYLFRSRQLNTIQCILSWEHM